MLLLNGFYQFNGELTTKHVKRRFFQLFRQVFLSFFINFYRKMDFIVFLNAFW